MTHPQPAQTRRGSDKGGTHGQQLKPLKQRADFTQLQTGIRAASCNCVIYSAFSTSN